MKISRFCWLVVAALALAACGGGPPGTPTPTPPPTLPPWRPPTVPLTADNAPQMGLLGISRAASGTVYHLDFSADGRYVVGVSAADNAVRLWDVTSGQALWALPGANTSRAFFGVEDAQVVLVTRSSEIRVLRAEESTALRDFRGHPSTIGPAAVSAGGRLLAVGGEDGTAIVWDLVAETRLYQLEAQGLPVQGVVFSPDGALLATFSRERVARLWDLSTGHTRAVLADFDREPRAVAFGSVGMAADGGVVALSTDNEVRLWSTADGAPLPTLHTELNAANRQIVFTPDGRLLGGGALDAVSLWDPMGGDLLASLPGHGDDFAMMALNPSGDLLVTVAEPGRVFLWDMHNPTRRSELSGEAEGIVRAGWTPDGRVLVLAAADGALYFYGIPGQAIP